MDKLITAKKKEICCDYLTVNAGETKIYMHVANISLLDVATIFGNPTEICQLWLGNLYFSGYTQLESIMPEPEGYRVVLRKE